MAIIIITLKEIRFLVIEEEEIINEKRERERDPDVCIKWA